MSLEKLGVDCQGRPGRVHGVCATPITTRGVVDLKVDFGVYPMKHRFIVLESRKQTIILGRDFLKRFNSTEFDWENHGFRLGEYWVPTEASLWGGRVLSRAGAIRCVVEEPECLPPTTTVEWNINPDLNQQERETLRTLLEEYLEGAKTLGAKTQLVHLNRCKKASQTIPCSGSGTPTHFMQGGTGERLSKEVSLIYVHSIYCDCVLSYYSLSLTSFDCLFEGGYYSSKYG